MQKYMLKLDRFLQRRRKLVLILWALVVAAAIPFAVQQSEHLSGGGVEAPDSQSKRVEQAIIDDFPEVPPASLAAIIVPHPGAGPAELSRGVTEVRQKVDRFTELDLDSAVADAASRKALQQPGSPVVLPLSVHTGESAAIDLAQQLRTALDIEGGEPGTAAMGRVDVHVGGQGALWAALQEESKNDVAVAEARGFPVIALVLLAAFGSLAAAALPLGLGVATVIVTGACVYGLSLAGDTSIYVTNMASMIGIGVAVDYSLFILTRYREGVRAGHPPEQARARALATSGLAVIFSGLTVVISLAGLYLVDSMVLRSMATGAIIVVTVSVIAASTLLPVLITIFGRRVGPVRRRFLPSRRRRERAPERRFWARWTSAVIRRPASAVLVAVATLLVLAAPTLDLKLGNSVLDQLPQTHETRRGAEQAAEVLGPGALGPAQVLVSFDEGTITDPGNRRTVDAVRSAINRESVVREISGGLGSDDGRAALLTANFNTDPEAKAARDGIDRLRAELPSAAGNDSRIDVGGTTATLVDFDELITDSLWQIMIFVLVASFVILLVLLRSIVLPLKAVLMNLLAVGAAYGVLVAVFQWGWLNFLGLESTPFIDTITPPLVFAIAFGLSMDYEIFLLSRIREHYEATGDNRAAISEGLASSAKTITSAALIMVAVFLAFVSAGLPAVQRLGLACAVAIAIDATIIRLLLVPAAMQLFGTWNWWLPKPLARLLPATDVERLNVELEPRSTEHEDVRTS